MTTSADYKEEGNDFFKKGDFLKAAGSYTKAIKVNFRLYVPSKSSESLVSCSLSYELF